MKTIKSSLFLSILTSFTLFVFSGCYTQLAYVADESDSIVDVSPIIIIIDPSPFPCPPPPLPRPTQPILPLPTQPPPVFNPLPPAKSSPTVTKPAPQPHRDSGYQRSSLSQNNQSDDSNPVIRKSGNQRSGR